MSTNIKWSEVLTLGTVVAIPTVCLFWCYHSTKNNTNGVKKTFGSATGLKTGLKTGSETGSGTGSETGSETGSKTRTRLNLKVKRENYGENDGFQLNHSGSEKNGDWIKAGARYGKTESQTQIFILLQRPEIKTDISSHDKVRVKIFFLEELVQEYTFWSFQSEYFYVDPKYCYISNFYIELHVNNQLHQTLQGCDIKLFTPKDLD